MASSNASKMAGEIDRQSGTPIYVQLREILRAHIENRARPDRRAVRAGPRRSGSGSPG